MYINFKLYIDYIKILGVIEMSIDKTIDDLYDILDGSWHLPLSGGKIIVDSKEIRCLLEDLRLKLPTEIVQAKSIVEDRYKIIDDAKQEADKIIKASQEKIKLMVNQSEIVKNAQMVASQILSEAKANSKEIKTAANQYVDNLMKDLDKIISSSLSDIRQARQTLHASDHKND